MTRAQVQIPDDLYERAERFSRDREMSIAEVVRRALELLLDRDPRHDIPQAWVLPTYDGGATLVPLADLKNFAFDEESSRGSGFEESRR